MSGHGTQQYVPAPCPRCTGMGDAHYLTCPTLRLPTVVTPDNWQQCVYCGWRAYERGWGCHQCGLCTVEDLAAREAAPVPP